MNQIQMTPPISDPLQNLSKSKTLPLKIWFLLRQLPLNIFPKVTTVLMIRAGKPRLSLPPVLSEKPSKFLLREFDATYAGSSSMRWKPQRTYWLSIIFPLWLAVLEKRKSTTSSSFFGVYRDGEPIEKVPL